MQMADHANEPPAGRLQAQNVQGLSQDGGIQGPEALVEEQAVKRPPTTLR